MLAACAQIPGFRQVFEEGKYVIKVGTELVQSTDVGFPLADNVQVVRLMPATQVAGAETLFIIGLGIIAGVALAVAFMPLAKAPDPNAREDDNKTSGVYDGPVNVQEQGHVRPLIYGRARVGSVVVSSGLDAGGRAVGVGSGTTGLLTPGAGGGGGRNPLGLDLVLEKGGKGGGGSSSAKEDPNSLQSNAVARIVDLLGEGEIVGLVDGLKSVYLDDTPVQNADNSYNFKGLEIEERVGTPDQDYMPGFASAENVRVINVEARIDTAAPVVTITNPNVNVAKVTVRLPALYSQNTSNGNITGTSVEFAIDVQANGGGYTEVIRHVINGKQNSPYQETYAVRLPAGGAPWNVRMRRITPDSASSALLNKTFLDLVTEVIERKFTYPNSAVIGLTADIRQFGSNIPTRSYDVQGLIVRVPSNYNPTTRVYTGVWDGLFVNAWTDNPVWCLFDLMTKKRYGLGRYIDESQIDKYALYSIAQYCDELIDNGMGGTEPRYRFNAVLTTRKQARQLIAEISATFRALSYWGTSQVMLTQDRPDAELPRIVAPANVVNGDFKYAGSARDEEHSAFVVWWNDPDNNYRLTPEIIEDKDLMLELGWKPLEYTAIGVTSPGHARRLALFMKEDQIAARQTLSYKTGFDHSFIVPNQVIDQTDPTRATVNWAGRIKAVSGTTITLDRNVALPAGPTYKLRVALSNGTIAERTINLGATGSTSTDDIVLSTAFSPQPPIDAMWALESTTLAPRPWRVRAIKDSEADGGYEVTAISYDETKYARIEGGVYIEPTPWTNLPTGPVEPPDGLFVTEFLKPVGDATLPFALFSWTPSTDGRVSAYEAQFKRPGGEWEVLDISERVTREVQILNVGAHFFRVRSLAGTSFKSPWRETEVALSGSSDTVPNVSGLTLTVDPDSFQSVVSWTMPADARPLEVLVFYNTVNTFSTATRIARVGGTTFIVPQVGYYWFQTVFGEAVSVSPPSIWVEDVDFADFSSGGITEVGFGNFAEGIEPIGIVNALPTPAGYVGPQIVFLTTDLRLYRYTGTGWTAGVATSDLTGTIGSGQIGTGAVGPSQIAAGAIEVAAFASGLRPIEIVAALPTTGNFAGRMVFLTSDNKVYRHTGSPSGSAGFVSTVATTDLTGTISSGQIAAGAVGTAAFASGLRPVEIVASLPTTGNFAGRMVFLTSDNKLYRHTGSPSGSAGFVASVAAADISGTLAAAQIASLTAAQITGTLTAAQIASLTAAQITGQIVGTQIADGSISTARLAAGAVTAATIAANTITAGQIAANTITAAQIAANTITAAQIAANTITAGQIAANTITAGQIAANTITASQIAADTITAAQIAAGAITASEIAAGAVTTSRLAVTDLTNVFPDPDIQEPTLWTVATDITVSDSTGTGAGFKSRGAITHTAGAATGYAYAAPPRRFQVDPARALRCEFQHEAGVAGNSNFWLRIHWYDGAGSALAGGEGSQYTTVANAPSVTATGLTNYSAMITPPATARQGELRFYVERTLSTRTFRLGGHVGRVAANGELIVDGSITAVKIAANTITASQIAANTITAGQIAADTITAGQIAAGAITASEIAAGAVTTAKLAVVGQGRAINPGADFTDDTCWYTASSNTGSYTLIADTTSPFGGNVLRAVGGVLVFPTRAVPISPNKLYNVRFWAKLVGAASGSAFIRCRTTTANGTIIADNALTRVTPAGGTFEGYTGFTTSWAEYVGTFTAQSNAARAEIHAYLNWTGAGGETRLAGFQLEERVAGQLIVDGTITATQIAAGSISADRLVANSITAGQIQAGAIGAAQIAAGSITADRLSVGSLSAISANLGTITAGSLNIGSGKFVVDSSGNVTIQSAASGQRLNLSNSALTVYDGSNVLRVRVGIW